VIAGHLVGRRVQVEGDDAAQTAGFAGVVHACVRTERGLRLLVEREPTGELYDASVIACTLLPTERRPAEDDPTMTEIAHAAVDYAMQHPAVDPDNEFQGSLLAAVANWMRRTDRSRWLTELCAGGACDQCHHDRCECPHHTGQPL
jgi:hypothetical protein